MTACSGLALMALSVRLVSKLNSRSTSPVSVSAWASVLKAMSFYGANASGKSSIIKGLAAFSELVVPNRMAPQGCLPYTPFSFADETKTAPTKMGIEFSLDNSESPFYKYEVSFNQTAIIFEKLEKYSFKSK